MLLKMLLLGLACLAANLMMITGECPEVKPQENFNFKDFAVTWYFGYVSNGAAKEFTDWKIVYGSVNEETHTAPLQISITEVVSGGEGERLQFDNTVTYNEAAAKITLAAVTEPRAQQLIGTYTIASTDYACYGIAVGCNPTHDKPLLIIQFRDQVPSQECVKKAKAAYSAAGLDLNEVTADPKVIKE